MHQLRRSERAASTLAANLDHDRDAGPAAGRPRPPAHRGTHPRRRHPPGRPRTSPTRSAPTTPTWRSSRVPLLRTADGDVPVDGPFAVRHRLAPLDAHLPTTDAVRTAVLVTVDDLEALRAGPSRPARRRQGRRHPVGRRRPAPRRHRPTVRRDRHVVGGTAVVHGRPRPLLDARRARRRHDATRRRGPAGGRALRAARRVRPTTRRRGDRRRRARRRRWPTEEPPCSAPRRPTASRSGRAVCSRERRPSTTVSTAARRAGDPATRR